VRFSSPQYIGALRALQETRATNRGYRCASGAAALTYPCVLVVVSRAVPALLHASVVHFHSISSQIRKVIIVPLVLGKYIRGKIRALRQFNGTCNAIRNARYRPDGLSSACHLLGRGVNKQERFVVARIQRAMRSKEGPPPLESLQIASLHLIRIAIYAQGLDAPPICIQDQQKESWW
jgi:hypothetical protein